MRVKDIGRSARKFVERASVAVEEYKYGVSNPKRPWKEATLAAVDVHKTAMQAALARDAFGKGVTKTPADKQSSRAAGKGADRYPSGVAGAEEDWRKGWDPYGAVLRGLTLGPRGPRGSEQNRKRSTDVQVALHRKRIGG